MRLARFGNARGRNGDARYGSQTVGRPSVAESLFRVVVVAVLACVTFPAPAGASAQDKCCNQVLGTGQQMNTGTGEVLTPQTDGNVVLYQNGVAQWQTSSTGQSGPFLKVQTDGNVVAYNSSGQWFWKTDTSHYPGAFLRLQDDGNLVVYSGSTAVWAKSWTKSSSGAKTYSQHQLSRYGWSASSQFPCLDSLWTNESGWQWNADNPSSSAYGIPQALPGTKMATEGSNWAIDGLTQVQWGLRYIDGRYQTPCGAWSAWQSRSPHWY
jgi:hypothetical protein